MRYAAGASSPGPTEVAAMDAHLARLYTGTIYTGGIAWLTDCPPSTTIAQIDYTILNGTALGITINHVAAGPSGTSMPSEVAAVLTLGTNTRGRRYRGRVYMPPLQASMLQSNGQMLAAKATNTRTQYLGMLAALAALQWVPVVASYGHGTLHGVPVTWTPFATDITDVRMDPILDVQRRRKS